MVDEQKVRVTVENLMEWGDYGWEGRILGLTEVEIKNYLRHPGTFIPTQTQIERMKEQSPHLEHRKRMTMDTWLRWIFSREIIRRRTQLVREQLEFEAREAEKRRREPVNYLRFFVRWKSEHEIRFERNKRRRMGTERAKALTARKNGRVTKQ